MAIEAIKYAPTCMRMIKNHQESQDDNPKTQESTKKMGSSALGIAAPQPRSEERRVGKEV